jgi:hypothetical protein
MTEFIGLLLTVCVLVWFACWAVALGVMWWFGWLA